MPKWKNCIVTYIDLIGIKEIASYTGSQATDIMLKMHSLVDRHASHEMPNQNYCYIWNDSILLLAYLDGNPRAAHKESIVREVDNLKRKVDQICPSYAISVQGQVFPNKPPLRDFNENTVGPTKIVRLRASSYALGNCFIIEERLGRKLKKPWYIDARIATHLSTKQKVSTHQAKLLPRNTRRDIYVYDGYLW